MRNYGKSLASLSGLGIQTMMELCNALLASAPEYGQSSIAVMGLDGNIRQLSSMKEIIMLNAKAATALKEASKPSTKKKSKRSTAKVRGNNSSLKAVKRAKGAK